MQQKLVTDLASKHALGS